MALDLNIPWHQESWQRFINESLPRLIKEHLPLANYEVVEQDEYTFALKLTFSFSGAEITVDYPDLPQPTAAGIFRVEGNYRVVVPYPSERNLETAEIYCVGEQLLDFFALRLGPTPEGMPLDEETLRLFLPIDTWMREFHAGMTSQYLQISNWLDRYTHLRRLTLLPIAPEPLAAGQHPDIPGTHKGRIFPAIQKGLVCPYCTPEGPNIGRVLEVARGATIKDGRLIRVDQSPVGHLGFSASMLPFIEHDDTNRALMGINMMRQWQNASDPELPIHAAGWQHGYHEKARASKGNKPEPALVQTGEEPDAPDFWGGYNLLTAYILWDEDAYEDAIVISRSAADRLDFPQPIEVGDRMSNRHGATSIISRILPDEEMPQLTDGTTVELIYNLCSLPSRLTFGQVREAVMGRIARAEGRPAIVPPFAAPSEAEIKKRLDNAGLPDDGMEQLSLGDEALTHRSTVGWVYWGRMVHTAQNKLQTDIGAGRPVGLPAFRTLLQDHMLAPANFHDLLNINSAERADAAALAQQGIDAGLPAVPGPHFAKIQRILRFAGIAATPNGDEVGFAFVDPEGLTLARPVPHPWAPQHQLKGIGRLQDLPAGDDALEDLYEEVQEANTRAERMIESSAPADLLQPALKQLQQRVEALFATILTPEDLALHSRAHFSASAVISPGPELNWDQVGLPEEMAWNLFGPQVAAALGDAAAVEKRSKKAGVKLDEIMADAWVLLYSGREILLDSPQQPDYHLAVIPLMAYRPVRHPDRVLRVHSRVCQLMEQDFDGNQMGVILPLGAEAQKEAGQRLSLLAQLTREPSFFDYLKPYHAAIWGLAYANHSEEGHRALCDLIGEDVPRGNIDQIQLHRRLKDVLIREGAAVALDRLHALLQHGFALAKKSGASFHPFIGAKLNLPEPPDNEDLEEWRIYHDEVVAELLRELDFDDSDVGPLVTLKDTGARGNGQQLRQYVGALGPHYRDDDSLHYIRGNLRTGLQAEDQFVRAPAALAGLAVAAQGWTYNRDKEDKGALPDYDNPHIIGRALRTTNPGVVFARAALRGDSDPLNSALSRVFVGLPPA